ncbi:ArgS-related anticodon-binding protein NrtL [Streptomyces sp. NPDC050085]|uniref:ArgS-related anticodon-binding protein NrtL n=1 Tax=Streptomyces sp. NPDC050085 TaxID=3365600 RepID=UPI00379F78E1
MTPAELSHTVLRAVRRAVDDGELDPAAVEPGAGRIVVERARPGGRGDYATNVALQVAGPAGRPPRQVAETLRPYLEDTDGVADVVVTGPGFLNFSLRAFAPGPLAAQILRDGSRYGFAAGPTGQVVQLHAPHEVRAVVVMDAAARILRSQGALVRTSCAARTEAAWTRILGAEVDAAGTPEAPAPLAVNVRPVPAPADPVPLGRDAARWALLHPAAHDRPRIDDAHLAQRESNPLFRVRYAHARTRALTRNAADLGFTAEPGDVTGEGDLLAALAEHPRVLQSAARHRAPDRLARHLVTVADTLLPALATVLPLGAEKPEAAHRARLALAEAAGTVLAGGLTLLGIDAPEHL